ncbi:type I restriction-modification system subunit M [Saprospira grandis]|uniref:type I restriction-modification system subunit M n=1 Tax=Saprospira grandis TaxID=1008 RepID=UPI0022DD5E35|nr:type I restriction-modification system subunit M [Saprospira grandis]WBM74820.1 type I restriction-modification system subunit M [Saprospira grandis]
MSEQDNQKKQLEQRLWNIADLLRGRMHADEFRDYMLGFIFFKFLSEQVEHYGNALLAGEYKMKYDELQEEKDQEILAAIKTSAVENHGFFLSPQLLFKQLAQHDGFIIEKLQEAFSLIENSSLGTDNEKAFAGLFEDVDLNSTKLGRNPDERNALISNILKELQKIDFKLEDSENDVLGDAYEYLIGQFASGAGKKAGEFYTPQQVSKILARLVVGERKRLRSVYDPSCGSGSLLLRVVRELKKDAEANSPDVFGQELNRTTYNLARMNMLLHGQKPDHFSIAQDDTLARPQHLDKKFEAIVANPPFSAKWEHNATYHNDERFSAYGKLAPKSKADFAFVQHMLHHLDEQGRMAVVLPHGVLFRGAAEGHIRKFILEQNFLDAVIGLPANIFYGTSIPTCILVFRKDREKNAPILFMDASAHFEKGKNQNNLRDEDVERIISHYQEKKESDKFSYLASLEEIAENDYNLNIPRYVDTFEEEEAVDLEAVALALKNLGAAEKESENKLQAFCQSLNIPTPF